MNCILFDVLRKIVVFIVINSLFIIDNSIFAAEQQDKSQQADEQFTITGTREQAEIDWMEKLHANVTNTVYISAMWFDTFFADEDAEELKPKSTARIRLGYAPKAGDWAETNAKFRLRVKLPHLQDKVDLIFSDDELDNINQLPLEAVNSGQHDHDDHFAAAVRFVHAATDNQFTDARIGISSGDIFYRTRYQRHFVINNNMALKFEPSVYYFLGDGLGAKLLMEYTHQLNLQEQLRVHYSVRGSESFSGLRWKHAFYHLNQFSLKDAGALGFIVEGERNGERGFIIDKYTLSYRYRFNAVKQWLFFDIEPFIEWPEQHNYKTVPGIALRVEGYFTRD